MTPAQQAIKAGLPSLAEVTRQTGVPKTTLERWHKTKPLLFGVLLRGCVK